MTLQWKCIMGQAMCFPGTHILTPAWFPVLYLSETPADVIAYTVSGVGSHRQISLKPHILKVGIIGIKTSEVDNEIASIPLGF